MLVGDQQPETEPKDGDHGLVLAWLGTLILNYVLSNKLGRAYAKTGYVLTGQANIVLAPDFSYIAQSRCQARSDDFLTIAPDLMVEVVSFNDTIQKIREMVDRFLVAGTRLMWLVFPITRTIHVYRTTNEITVFGIDDTVDGGDVLPGLKVPLAEIFSVLDSQS